MWIELQNNRFYIGKLLDFEKVLILIGIHFCRRNIFMGNSHLYDPSLLMLENGFAALSSGPLVRYKLEPVSVELSFWFESPKPIFCYSVMTLRQAAN